MLALPLNAAKLGSGSQIFEEWRVDYVVWNVRRTNADAGPLIQIDVSSDYLRLFVSDLPLTTNATQKLAPAQFTAAVDELDSRGCSFLAIEVRTDGQLRLATDALGSELAFASIAQDQAIISNERKSFVANTNTLTRGFTFNTRSTRRFVGSVTDGKIAADTGFVREPSNSIGLTAGTVRKTLSAELAKLSTRFERVAILLSGGIDSAAIAAAVEHDFSRITLLHARFPESYRAWETTLARATARRTGLTLAEVAFQPDRFFTLNADPDRYRHVWFDWQAHLQRVAASSADAIVTGRSGQWFGGDTPADIWSLGLTGLKMLAPMLWRVIPWRRAAFDVLRNKKRTQTSPAAYPWSFEAGQRYLYANTEFGPCAPKFCPYQNWTIFDVATSLVGTGARVEKLALRYAFRTELPSRVLLTPRISSPLLSKYTWREVPTSQLSAAAVLEKKLVASALGTGALFPIRPGAYVYAG